MKPVRIIGQCLSLMNRIANRCIASYQLSLFSKIGRNCFLNGPGRFSYKNIILGNDVYIGVNSYFISSDAKIIIGNKVVFGPHVFLISGNHRFDVIGQYIADIKEKRPQDDADIVIGDDVWIGAGAIILKGVRIGKGCVIGAGAIVTKNIPDYHIYTNKGLKERFNDLEIIEHERILSNSKI